MTTPYYRIFFAKGDEEKIKEGLKQLVEGLELFEKELQRRGTLFFAGVFSLSYLKPFLVNLGGSSLWLFDCIRQRSSGNA